MTSDLARGRPNARVSLRVWRQAGPSAPGGFERFFAEVGSPAQDDGLPPQAPPDVARLKRIGERFGLEIVGPPLS
jgi:hypothetical protein